MTTRLTAECGTSDPLPHRMATGQRGQLFHPEVEAVGELPRTPDSIFLLKVCLPLTQPLLPLPAPFIKTVSKKEGKEKLLLIRYGSYRLWGKGGERVILMKLISN